MKELVITLFAFLIVTGCHNMHLGVEPGNENAIPNENAVWFDEFVDAVARNQKIQEVIDIGKAKQIKGAGT